MEISKLDGRFRFCAFQAYDGLRRHYICNHNEYCCTLGCCVSSAFNFYQLWYFWLLVLLIILLCSGGGWWFRWRHGNFGFRSSPAQGHRRHGRHANRAPRVYPHSYYGNAASCRLPPGYDKDPPSYNEVISHLNQFPKLDELPTDETGTSTMTNTPTLSVNPADSLLLTVPPPSYQMVLDLKRREIELEREIADEERLERVRNSRGKIQKLLGMARRKKTPEPRQTIPPPPPTVASFPTSSSSLSLPSLSSSPPSSSSGLFTISRESLSPSELYTQASSGSTSSIIALEGGQSHSPTPNDTSSHSDYYSAFVPTPVSGSRSPSTSPQRSLPSVSPTLVSPTSPIIPNDSRPSTSQTEEVTRGEEELLDVDRGGAHRPTTGRSVLARPTTSISARSLPLPPEIQRKTSLPGALVESDGEENEEAT